MKEGACFVGSRVESEAESAKSRLDELSITSRIIGGKWLLQGCIAGARKS